MTSATSTGYQMKPKDLSFHMTQIMMQDKNCGLHRPKFRKKNFVTFVTLIAFWNVQQYRASHCGVVNAYVPLPNDFCINHQTFQALPVCLTDVVIPFTTGIFCIFVLGRPYHYHIINQGWWKLMKSGCPIYFFCL